MAAFIEAFFRHIFDRMSADLPGYFSRHRMLMIIVSFAAAADLASTVHFMTADGVDQELHPAIRVAASWWGPWIGVTLGKLGQLSAILVVTLYAREVTRHVFLTATLMYAWAAWYNVWGYEIYTPLLVRVLTW